MSKKIVKRSLAKKIMVSVFGGMILFSNGVVFAANVGTGTFCGDYSEAYDNSVAVGQMVFAYKQNVAIGDNSKATGWNSVAIGNGSQATEDYVVSVGYGGTNGGGTTIDHYGTLFAVPNTRSIINVTDILVANNLQRLAVDQSATMAKNIAEMTRDERKALGSYVVNFATLEQAMYEEATARETKDNELLEKIIQIDSDNTASIDNLNQRLDRTNAKINKVGAGAAALAALHPLEYDPDDKLTFSAGMGNYAGENAAALGAFYRPNEKFMVSLGGTMGNGENMVNLGLSIGLDKPNGLAKLSKRELIQKVNAVEAENDALEDRVAKLEALVAQLANK